MPWEFNDLVTSNQFTVQRVSNTRRVNEWAKWMSKIINKWMSESLAYYGSIFMGTTTCDLAITRLVRIGSLPFCYIWCKSLALLSLEASLHAWLNTVNTHISLLYHIWAALAIKAVVESIYMDMYQALAIVLLNTQCLLTWWDAYSSLQNVKKINIKNPTWLTWVYLFRWWR